MEVLKVLIFRSREFYKRRGNNLRGISEYLQSSREREHSEGFLTVLCFTFDRYNRAAQVRVEPAQASLRRLPLHHYLQGTNIKDKSAFMFHV